MIGCVMRGGDERCVDIGGVMRGYVITPVS